MVVGVGVGFGQKFGVSLHLDAKCWDRQGCCRASNTVSAKC
jgi:hypothetical protein